MCVFQTERHEKTVRLTAVPVPRCACSACTHCSPPARLRPAKKNVLYIADNCNNDMCCCEISYSQYCRGTRQNSWWACLCTFVGGHLKGCWLREGLHCAASPAGQRDWSDLPCSVLKGGQQRSKAKASALCVVPQNCPFRSFCRAFRKWNGAYLGQSVGAGGGPDATAALPAVKREYPKQRLQTSLPAEKR